MNKITGVAMILATTWVSSCSILHDEKGWEHQGDSETHQDSQPYILEHKH